MRGPWPIGAVVPKTNKQNGSNNLIRQMGQMWHDYVKKQPHNRLYQQTHGCLHQWHSNLHQHLQTSTPIIDAKLHQRTHTSAQYHIPVYTNDTDHSTPQDTHQSVPMTLQPMSTDTHTSVYQGKHTSLHQWHTTIHQLTYLLTYLLAYFMEQSPSWEANWFCS